MQTLHLLNRFGVSEEFYQELTQICIVLLNKNMNIRNINFNIGVCRFAVQLGSEGHKEVS